MNSLKILRENLNARSPHLNLDTVYRWFSSPPQKNRIEKEKKRERKEEKRRKKEERTETIFCCHNIYTAI